MGDVDGVVGFKGEVGAFVALLGDAVDFHLDALAGAAGAAQDLGAVGGGEIGEAAGEGYGLEDGKVALGGDLDGAGLFDLAQDVDLFIALLFDEDGDLGFYQELGELFG